MAQALACGSGFVDICPAIAKAVDFNCASIISKGRSTVRRFPGDKLFEVIENYPEVTKHLFRTLVNRLEHSNEIIMKLANGRKAR